MNHIIEQIASNAWLHENVFKWCTSCKWITLRKAQSTLNWEMFLFFWGGKKKQAQRSHHHKEELKKQVKNIK